MDGGTASRSGNILPFLTWQQIMLSSNMLSSDMGNNLIYSILYCIQVSLKYTMKSTK